MNFEKAHYVARLQRWKEGSCFDVPFLFWQEPTLHCDSGTLLQSLFKEIKMNRPLVSKLPGSVLTMSSYSIANGFVVAGFQLAYNLSSKSVVTTV
jgi:hypothetical protein